jgi:hypothetical protein
VTDSNEESITPEQLPSPDANHGPEPDTDESAEPIDGGTEPDTDESAEPYTDESAEPYTDDGTEPIDGEGTDSPTALSETDDSEPIPATHPASPTPAPAPPPATGSPEQGETAQKPKLSKGLLIGLVGLLAIAIGAFLFLRPSGGGSATSEAAAERLLRQIEDRDLVGIYQSFAPSERELLAELTSALEANSASGGVDLEQIGRDLAEALQVDVADVTFDVTESNEDYAIATMTSGLITVTWDRAQLVGIAAEQLHRFSDDQVLSQDQYATILDGEYGRWFEEQEAQEAIEIQPAIPEANAEEGRIPVSVGLVRENGRWYVSPLMTAGEFAYQWAHGPDDVQSTFARQPIDAFETWVGADDAYEAPAAFLQNYAQGFSSGDLLGNADSWRYLTFPERRVFAYYGTEISSLLVERHDVVPEGATLDFELLQLRPDGLDGQIIPIETLELRYAEGPDDEGERHVYEEHCYRSTCFEDDAAINVVQEDGTWRVSIIGTAVASLERLTGVSEEPWSGSQAEGPTPETVMSLADWVHQAFIDRFQDPALDQMQEACIGHDFATCDALAEQAPVGTGYWETGLRCGGGRPLDEGTDTSCVAWAPIHVEELHQECAEEGGRTCDELYGFAVDNPEEQQFGATCGGRVNDGVMTGTCYFYFENFKDLQTDCIAGDADSCDLLWYNAPKPSELETLGATCGGALPTTENAGNCWEAIGQSWGSRVDQTLGAWELHTGDCVMSLGEVLHDETESGDVVQVVDCSEPHDGEIIADRMVLESTFPGSDVLKSMTDSFCLSADAGMPWGTSELELWSLYPSEESWASAADRRILCALYYPGR